jgi:hypothetical protein
MVVEFAESLDDMVDDVPGSHVPEVALGLQFQEVP